MIRGIGGAEGIAIGKAFVVNETQINIVHHKVEDVEAEVARFNVAAEKCHEELERLHNKTLNILGEVEAEVYKRHLSVFDGSILLGQVRKEIQDQGNNAEYILNEVMKKYASMFDRVADEFLKKKSESIKYIAKEMIRELMGMDAKGLSDIVEPVILIATDLDKNDIMQIDQDFILAIVTEVGNKTSPASLLADNLHIPCVVGARGIMEAVTEDVEVIVDGSKGEVFVKPDQSTINLYFRKVNKEKELEAIFKSFAGEATKTLDEHHFDISAKIEHVIDVLEISAVGAEGIGLFGTEYLFIGRDKAPDEETQFLSYRDAVIGAHGMSVVFRVLDITASNDLPFVYIPKEKNPMLGYKGIRLLLMEREMFITQLKAILKASAYGPSKLLLPNLTNLEDLVEAKMALEEAKMALEEEGELYDPELQIGISIDLPAVALNIEAFAREVNFVMVETSNLAQLLLGVERNNEALMNYYDMYHPGMIKLIQQCIVGAHKEGTRVIIAGDMTKEEYLLPYYVALGVDQACMEIGAVLRSRWAASKMTKALWEPRIPEILELATSSEVKQYLEKYYYDEILWSEETQGS